MCFFIETKKDTNSKVAGGPNGKIDCINPTLWAQNMWKEKHPANQHVALTKVLGF